MGLSEHNHQRNASAKYSAGADGALRRSGGGRRGLVRVLRDTFLPRDFPDSVAPEYGTYQLYDTAQALCSYLRGILSTTKLLEGAGVGRADATPLAAAVNFLLKDGAGMFGGLVFGWAASGSFDSNIKFWRLFADVINDVALTLDMLAPLFPDYFLGILCVSAVCKSLCGVSAGASKAALSAHFARRDNMGDVAVKEGAQETAVSLAGLVMGVWFAKAVNHSLALVWGAFAALTALHVVCNYRAVRSVRLPTLNRQRLRIALARFQAGGELSVDAVGRAENVWRLQPDGFRLGVRVADVAQSTVEAAAVEAELAAGPVCRRPHGAVLREDAGPLDLLRAYVWFVSPAADCDAFIEALRGAGWRLDRLMLGGDEGWRVRVDS